MESLDKYRNFVISIINNVKISDEENISTLDNYIKENNFVLDELNNENFDILIYAIDSRASQELIKYIVNHTYYETYNYVFYITEGYMRYDPKYQFINTEYMVPLFSAVNHQYFEVADLLIKKKNADINYLAFDEESIIIYLYENCCNLNTTVLKYIQRRGFYVRGFPIGLINVLISEYRNDNLIKTIFKEYIFDNIFILKLLSIYKQKTCLSDEQIEDLIRFEKSKLKINDMSYFNALKSGNYKAIATLLKYDSDPPEIIIDRIKRFNFLNLNDNKVEYKIKSDIIVEVLKHKLYSFNIPILEELFMDVKHDRTVRFLFNLYINKLFKSTSFNFLGSHCENLLLASSHFNDKNIMEPVLIGILSESKDPLIYDKLSIKYSKERLEDIKSLVETSQGIMKEHYTQFLNEILEASDPLSVSLIREGKPSFFSLIINIAIKTENFDRVKFLVENEDLKGKIDLNQKDKNGEYPIVVALSKAKTNNDALELLQYMIEHGANYYIKENQGLSILTLALISKRYKALKYLLKQKDLIINENKEKDKDCNLIIQAIFQNNFNRIKQLINENTISDYLNKKKMYNNTDHNIDNDLDIDIDIDIDISNKSASEISNHNNFEINPTSLNNDDSDLDDDDSMSVDMEGSNADDTLNIDKNPISSSFNNDSIEFIPYNYRNKKVNRYNHSSNSKTYQNFEYSYTPLALAYLLDEKDIFNYLIEQGCPVNEEDNYGYNVLHFMILKDDIEMVKFLIDKTDINVNFQPKGKINRCHSALDIAVNNCHKNMILTLLRSPTLNINQTNSFNEIFLFTIMKTERFSLEDKIEILEYVFKKGSEINTVDHFGKSALAYAIQSSSLSLVKLFIDHGADANFVDRNKNSPLSYAIQVKSESIVSLLIEHGAEADFIDIFNVSLLTYAIQERYLPIVKILVDHGADVNFVIHVSDERNPDQCMFIYAIDHSELPIVQYLVEHGVNYDFKSEDSLCELMPFLFIAFRLDILEYLLKIKKIDIHDLTLRTLKDLIWRDRVDLLKILIKYGFNIDMKDETNETLLVKAVKFRKDSLVKYLLELGADIQPLNDNILHLKSLMYDDKSKNYTILNMLVDHGLNVNTQDERGETLLIYAVEGEKLDIIKCLLDHGANPLFVNEKHQEHFSVEDYNEFYNFSSDLSTYKKIRDILNQYINKQR